MGKNIFGLTVSVALVLAAFSIAAAAPGNTAGKSGASGEAGTSAEIASLNAVLDFAGAQSQRASDTLIDRMYEQGSLPVIVRLRENGKPYGVFSRTSKSRREVIEGLQGRVLEHVFAQTARDEFQMRTKRFSRIPAMALQADASVLEALLANPNVVDVIEDIAVPPALDVSVPLIGAGLDGSFSTYTGLGQTVAILDTGVDKSHPFLSGKIVSEACYSSNVSSQGATSVCPGGATDSTAVGSGLPCDISVYGCKHGTHVAGIAAGSGDTFSGVANDASVIAIQVFSRFSRNCGSLPVPCAMSYSSDQIKGLERVYALRDAYKIASANMSLGGGSYADPCNTNVLKPIIDSLRAEGIATVISSGNASYTSSIGSPGCIGSAVSVGSTTDADVVSAFSNSAYFLSLLAPGQSIISSVPGTTYESWGGTSMAAPHVTGAWAVLKQAKPNADVAEMLGALQFNGVPVTDTRTGAGSRVKPRIDVQDALDSLLVPGVWIAWDDGVQMDAVGLTEGGTFTAASLWQPADIPGGGTITKVRVGVYDLPVSAAVEIWQGSDAASMELQYSQAFTPAAGQINEIVLDTPYVIDATKDLLIGWSATHSAGDYPIALDIATSAYQPENWLLLNDVWQTAVLTGDFIVHAFIDGKCFLDDDCLAEKPFCDSYVCVACVTEADCVGGEVCEAGQCVDPIDTDFDGIIDIEDNCPDICNPQQFDADDDGIGDVCDTAPGCGGCGQPVCEIQGQCDSDQDGIADGADNCPATCNTQQKDADGDGIGDVCDTTPGCGGCGQPVCEVVCVSQ